MKKLLCVFLSLALCLSFAACGKDKDLANDESKGTIDAFASQGQIPELEIKLGSTPDEATAFYNTAATENDNPDLVLGEMVGETAVVLSNGIDSFYYEKQNAQYGISVIALTGGTAYGLEIANTTTKSDVEALLSAKYTVNAATPEQLFFLPGVVDGAEVLTCSFENIRLDFFFFEDILSAVTLTNTTYWKD